MASGTVPGPLSQETVAGGVQDGTSALAPSPTPGPLGVAPAPEATPAGAATPLDQEIEALDLAATAKAAAYDLKKKHPTVKFTSGRRDKADQARAMASNVVENRKWIEQTYAASTARTDCQKWVDDHPDKKTQDEIDEGLRGVLDELSDAQLAVLSKHLSGEAFDVQPVDTDAETIKESIRGLSGLTKFLEKEGGLTRWHAQF